MENLISSRCEVRTVPESYVLPPEKRPGKLVFPLCSTIPVIDLEGLGRYPNELIQQIIKASQEYGFFQLTNHGVSDELMKDVLKVGKEFFDLPAGDKASFYSETVGSFDDCILRTSFDYTHEKVRHWRDYFRQACHPLEKHMQNWPKNPPRYRDVVGRYSVEVRRLSMLLLDLICQGLGLERGYLEGELSQGQMMIINHYPPCADPSLVLGLPKHADPYLLTLLNQGEIPGLQVFKDEEWLEVEPIPNAFVVNINHALQVISNGKLKSADHRAVTNSSTVRTSIVSFIHPGADSLIKPAESLIDKCNPPLYKAFIFKDFLGTYSESVREGNDPLQHFMIGC